MPYIVQIENADRKILSNEVINQDILLLHKNNLKDISFDFVKITEATEISKIEESNFLRILQKMLTEHGVIVKGNGFYFTPEFCINCNIKKYEKLKNYFSELTFEQYMNPHTWIDIHYQHIKYDFPFGTLYVHSKSLGIHHVSFEEFIKLLYKKDLTHSPFTTKFKLIKIMECTLCNQVYGDSCI